MLREIVIIDEELCDGCGLCIPSCAEGALKIINGKAKLVSDNLCDGMGACLGHCPKGAIRIEQREADEFDEREVQRQKAASKAVKPSLKLTDAPPQGGCPGSRFAMFGAPPAANTPASAASTAQASRSELRHWPVQLRLLSAQAPVLKEASLLVAADCVPVAYPDFHAKLLAGHAVVIGCPKFDDMEEGVARLAAIISANELKEITVARMTVPCCAGILHAVLRARDIAGKQVLVKSVVIAPQGESTVERINSR